jgi:hypothetical protein
MPVFDTEADGLYPSKFHVLTYYDGEDYVSLTSHEEIAEWLLEQDVLIGHNIIGFDIPQLERVLNIKIKATLIDTLYLSWYLFPERRLHGLAWWGEDFGVPKPKVDDWSDQPLHVYVNRCREDVKINVKLWNKERDYLKLLYDTKSPESLPIVKYLMFKADCAREQEASGWKLDIEWCNNAIQELEGQQEPLLEALARSMPTVMKTALKHPPTKPYKKDGTLSVEGAKWRKYLSERGLTLDHSLPISVVVREEPPNPDSPQQVKDWLYSLGWEPETFKFIREDDGTERQIPQIKLPDSPDLCPSVLALAEKEPAILSLEGLSVLKHRLGILQGFLKNVDSRGFLKARVQGLTNTLRFRHTEIVNLPGVNKPFGLQVRGCLVAKDGYELVGTDMVSLEDTTKRHYMYIYDPDYVNEMSDPGFDPHLDLAIAAGVLSDKDFEYYKANKKDSKDVKISEITALRKAYKVVNYSAVYGVKPPRLSRTLNCTLSFAKKLLKDYWKRNWSVEKVAESCEVKTVNGQKWLFNPVSKFWYSLRHEKDRFSTLNQGTGVFCFDSWVRECRKLGLQLTAQFHDESLSEVLKEDVDKAMKLQQKAIEIVNKKLNLNVKLAITPQHGHRYSDVH